MLTGFNREDDTPKGPFMPFVRITVLGPADSGKTSLINSWVNNFCPSVHMPTEDTLFYYRTLRLQNPADESELVTGLVEIEDTCDSRQEGLEQLLSITARKTNQGKKYSGGGGKGPMAECPAPSRIDCKPMTKVRMGFLIVFDANVEESLVEAQRVCRMLLDQGDLSNHYLIFVANKIDKDPVNATMQRTVRAAREFAQTEGVRFAEVSALEFTRVRKVFRELIEELSVRTSLYMTQDELKQMQNLNAKKKKEAAGGGRLVGEECCVQ